MKDWTPVDWVAVILTLAVTGVLVAAVGIAGARGEPMPETHAKALAATVGAVIAILAAYVAKRL